jgi:predicted SAM-dependent methyltransferase
MTRWLGFGARREHPDTLLVDIRPGVGDRQADIRHLPFVDGWFVGVECHHVIEHLTPEDATRALAEIHRVLQPGGILEISCPDLEACARTLLAGNLEILQNFYSPHADEAQRHRWGYTWASLTAQLTRGGFVAITPMPLTEPHEIRLRARRRA